MICILFFEDYQIHGALDSSKAYFTRTSIFGWIHIANLLSRVQNTNNNLAVKALNS